MVIKKDAKKSIKKRVVKRSKRTLSILYVLVALALVGVVIGGYFVLQRFAIHMDKLIW